MSKSSFLIQYLRKSKLGNDFLAGYLNTILKSLINHNINDSFEINIRGGCWSTKVNTAYDLIDKVFAAVDLSKTTILLHNHYPRFSSSFTCEALKSYLRSSSCFCGTNDPDHSKEVLIKCNGETIFYMVGSSNFSRSTYMTNDRNVNQSDISFIRFNDQTRRLLSSIIYSDSNVMLTYYGEREGISNDNSSETEYTQYVKENHLEIVTTPYVGSDDLLSEYADEFFSNIRLDEAIVKNDHFEQ
ncbi:hypothetical protein ACWOC1_06015 [Enterococcus quebecensis]|uniref:Phospholipase D-like domain-containing protein n=1 Tax=Enterococcus quebecensis TaxID=903983 RepID=A0A1E5GUZ7_9ENTE|nr:hypothetical protein [Enterococcus quebecensis]OEG16516.1 hypothetical protein BCR23_06405 [Enterococcus quebecensis]